MNKMRLLMCVAAGLVAVMSGSVSAGMTYPFTDTIEFTASTNRYWNGSTDSLSYGKLLLEGTGSSPSVNNPFDYAHNIGSVVNLGAGDLVTDAELTVTFWDDESDSGNAANREVVRVGVWNGTTWAWNQLGDVGTGGYSGSQINAGWLNDDGILGVRVEVTNNGGDIWLTSSALTGFAIAAVPLPTSILLGVFAVGLAGSKLRKFV